MAPRASGAIETHAWRDGRTVTIRGRVRAYGRRYRSTSAQPRGLERRASMCRARPHPPAGRARHLGAAKPERRLERRDRRRGDRPRDRLALVAAAQGRARTEHAPGLPLAPRPRPPPPRARHDRRARRPSRRHVPRRARGRRSRPAQREHDPRPARADPGRRRRVRAADREPRTRQAPAPEGAEARPGRSSNPTWSSTSSTSQRSGSAASRRISATGGGRSLQRCA